MAFALKQERAVISLERRQFTIRDATRAVLKNAPRGIFLKDEFTVP